MHLEYAVVLIMASILNGYKLNAARRDLMRNIISLTFTKDNITVEIIILKAYLLFHSINVS